jgi:hypothetical protein
LPTKIAHRAISAGQSKETKMKNRTTAALAAAALAATLGGCAQMQSMLPGSGWTTLVDGTRGMENFHRVGEANWTATDGAIQATAGGKDPAYLLSNQSYRDFMLRVEFWASDDANSGIFLRCQNPGNVGDETCYEANIFDQRPDPSYATGAIVKVAKVPANFQRAGGKWNVYEITAQGDQLVVMLNGQKTVDVHEDVRRFAGGPIGLQWGRGTIKFRKVQIRPL